MQLDFDPPATLLAWRPSGVTVGGGRHRGRVIASSFAGGHREYVLESDLGQVKAEAPIEVPEVPIGDSVAFDLPQSTARPLAA